jgi:hypothetical protein
MASKFAIGDKVDQAFSNHAEETVVAIFTDLAGEHRYAVEIFGPQIASESSLSRTAILPSGLTQQGHRPDAGRQRKHP